MDLFYILIISLVVVLFFAMSIIIYLNIKATKIKKQVLSGTYVSKKEISNKVNNNETKEEVNKNQEINVKKNNFYTQEELKKMTVLDLKELMKYEKIKFNSTDKKNDLINKILVWYGKE